MIARLKMAWRILRGTACPAPYFLPTIKISKKGAIIESRTHGWINIEVRDDE